VVEVYDGDDNESGNKKKIEKITQGKSELYEQNE
jgi:hypothetical protein